MSGAYCASSARQRNYELRGHRTDDLIQYMKDMMKHSFFLNSMATTGADTMSFFEGLIHDHKGKPEHSRLSTMVPTVGKFFTDLPLRDAFLAYDNKYHVTARSKVPVTFNELRHMLNLAQTMAIGDKLKLLTFDGDCTLYANGKNFENMKIARFLVKMLKAGVHIALVTAAGYGFDGARYERRIAALLDYFRAPEQGCTAEELGRFFVLGGECNFLFKCNQHAHLEPLEQKLWLPESESWRESEITRLLDEAEASLKDSMKRMNIRGRIIRKSRAVGIIPGGCDGKKLFPGGSGGKSIRREILDEVVICVQERLRAADLRIPYCAFNGGADVFIDVGNKRVGVCGLINYLGLYRQDCVHFGDQFLNTGNDYACRDSCPCVWVANPDETKHVLKDMLKRLGINTKEKKGELAHGEPEPEGRSPRPRLQTCNVLYHMVPSSLWNDASRTTYFPATYDSDGFTHLTADPASLLSVANHFYKTWDVKDDWLLLGLLKDKIDTGEVKYEAAAAVGGQAAHSAEGGALFPHLYGGIHDAAVFDYAVMPREENGTFTGVPALSLPGDVHPMV